MPGQSSSVKINTELYEEVKSLCEATGHRIQFHLDRALQNYLADEAPVWRKAAAETQKKLKPTK